MVHVAAEMEREGFDIPLLIGGATTSRVHTAVKIHPRYGSGPDGLCQRRQPRGRRRVEPAVDRSAKDGYVETVRAEYRKVADAHRARRKPTSCGCRSPRRAPMRTQIDWASYEPPKPSFLGTRAFENWDLAELARYIDWTPFFQTWELKGRYPKILEDEAQGAAARAAVRRRAGDAAEDHRREMVRAEGA